MPWRSLGFGMALAALARPALSEEPADAAAAAAAILESAPTDAAVPAPAPSDRRWEEVGRSLDAGAIDDAMEEAASATMESAPPALLERLLALAESRFPTELRESFRFCGPHFEFKNRCTPEFRLLMHCRAKAYPILSRLAQSDEPLKRRNALFVLMSTDDPQRWAMGERALHDADARVRRVAIQLLAEHGCASVEAGP
jgi:hypothetical protein